jgi:enoyl-CoA hydratase/carnithine racemase
VLAVEEARTLGVVDEVVAATRLLSRAESLAARIARSDRDAVAATKRLMMDEPDLSAHEREFAAFWNSAATLPA